MDYIKVLIWKMGIVESYQRGLSLRYRWHWQCRACHLTDQYGHSSPGEAEISAQLHVYERHDDD